MLIGGNPLEEKMACFISNRHSCVGPYYPCPISCCSCSRCCSNIVQNPPVVATNLAFFALTTTTSVASGAIVPVSLVSNFGTAITSSSVGTATLSAGTYEATYNVVSVLGGNGTNSFGLQLNGAIIPASVSTTEGTAGEVSTVSNSVVFTVSATGTLTLNNLGSETVDVNVANLTIRKIS